MKYVPLGPTDIDAALAELPGWSFDSDRLEKTVKLRDFASAIRFMAACVPAIDALDHHPTWTNVYSTVSIQLTTHDVGNRVTTKDVELAKAIDAVLAGGGEAFGYRAP